MERNEKTIEVDRPVRMVYNQRTQFEEFPRFMDGVKEVKQSGRVEKSVKQFTKHIESRGVEDGAWRGELRDRKPQRPH